MRLTTLILITAILQVSASSFAQKVSLSEKNTSLDKVFDQIRTQTGYDFFFTTSILQQAKPVTINAKNEELEVVLKKIFANQDLKYAINKKSVIVSKKAPSFLDKVVDAFTLPIDVSGRVLDEKGEPLSGANVKVKGTNKSTFTGKDGRFYLAGVDDKAVLVISYVGYVEKEIGVKRELTVTMEQKSAELEEVVVAYGKTTQQALTGAVTVVKGEEIQTLPHRSFDKSLQGLVPGLQITGGTGQPGGSTGSMVMRGIATGTDVNTGQTVRNPLIVIDGIFISQDGFQYLLPSSNTPITNPISQLNPGDIESISILKDASAIALYGSQASNGVILVTTKRGKTGKLTFNFSNQTDIASKTKNKAISLNQGEYIQLLYETYKNTIKVANGVSVPWSDADILADLKSKFPVMSNGEFYPNPDWQNELLTKTALTQSNQLSISGGNDKNNYYLNGEYSKQNGIVKTTGYDRASLRINFESRPSNWISLGTRTALSYNVQDYSAGAPEGSAGYSFGDGMSPLNPVRLEDGNYQFTYPYGSTTTFVFNPRASIDYNILNNTSYRGLSSFYLEVKPLKAISFSSNFGGDFMLAENKETSNPVFYQNSFTPGLPSIGEKDQRSANLIFTNILRFNQRMGTVHSVDALISQESRMVTNKVLGAAATGTAETLPYYKQLKSLGYTMSEIFSSSSKQTLASFLGQINYGVMNRYFLSVSLRKDGSSKFGDQQRWGTYWSSGAGWVISEENFVKQHTPWLSYAKLRGSIGVAGNAAAIDQYARFDLLSAIRYQTENGIKPEGGWGNPDIRWERTFTWNAGGEVNLFDNRIGIIADLYSRMTKDLIYGTTLPSVAGAAVIFENIGNMRNSGIEVSIQGKVIKNKHFEWILNGDWSSNRNVLVKANVPLTTISGGLLGNEEGRNFNSFYMPVWAGVNPVNGLPQWLDVLGNPTSSYGLAKKEFVGQPQPTGFGGITNTFRYHGFEVSARFYYRYGAKLYNSTLAFPMLTDGLTPYVNQVKEALDYWRKPGDMAMNPRRLLNNTDGGYNASTRFLFNGDYMRLQNIILRYSLPTTVIQKFGMNALSIFLQGHDLALLTSYPGPDPDNSGVAGRTGFAYPNQSSYTVGINLSF